MKYTLRVPGVRKNADFSPVQPDDFVQTRKNMRAARGGACARWANML
jgi:hypothetical protein